MCHGDRFGWTRLDTHRTEDAPQHVDLIHEAEALTGCEGRTQTQLRKLADRLHAEGVERIFITRGNKGVFYSTSDTHGAQKLQHGKRDVHNAGGAGDAFLAGLAYAWLEDYSLDDSVLFALAAADITLSHSATSSPALSLAAINEFLETHSAG